MQFMNNLVAMEPSAITMLITFHFASSGRHEPLLYLLVYPLRIVFGEKVTPGAWVHWSTSHDLDHALAGRRSTDKNTRILQVQSRALASYLPLQEKAAVGAPSTADL